MELKPLDQSHPQGLSQSNLMRTLLCFHTSYKRKAVCDIDQGLILVVDGWDCEKDVVIRPIPKICSHVDNSVAKIGHLTFSSIHYTMTNYDNCQCSEPNSFPSQTSRAPTLSTLPRPCVGQNTPYEPLVSALCWRGNR